jgi:hypothetical protein
MLVVRWTFHATPGHAGQVRNWLRSWTDFGFPAPPHGWRIYRAGNFSPRHVVVSEMDFESLAEVDAWWKEAAASPRWGEALGAVFELEDAGGSELWQMEELK